MGLLRRIKRPSLPAALVGVMISPLLAWPCLLLWFHFLRCGPTRYADGYSEARFLRLREGMSAREVESLLGRPLERVSQADGEELWAYSNRDDDTCDFEMRWVYLDRGRVKSIANLHWDD
ncbi:hypothetical protein OJF2_41370 [Aquisphaera giovannonii]|uniref:Lipoprotein SmpA/OmlA domain-containing protein n=1 Tax=Aquisphaera giovannonii TaxID=406548 RepID=A0A5B9W5V2_9BACT|nr:hypothetical protein OJF2_41370 [Aquisphaera giovannonii]